MNSSLVSIITPSFNSSRFIKETIASVQAQTYSYWEMLITDDGSTDNSINILAISTSEIKISVLIDKKFTKIAVKSLHEAYNLGQ